jgi:hypothetical protein
VHRGERLVDRRVKAEAIVHRAREEVADLPEMVGEHQLLSVRAQLVGQLDLTDPRLNSATVLGEGDGEIPADE